MIKGRNQSCCFSTCGKASFACVIAVGVARWGMRITVWSGRSCCRLGSPYAWCCSCFIRCHFSYMSVRHLFDHRGPIASMILELLTFVVGVIWLANRQCPHRSTFVFGPRTWSNGYLSDTFVRPACGCISFFGCSHLTTLRHFGCGFS